MKRVLDIIFAGWILFVAAIYFGPLVWPELGLMTTPLTAVYAVFLIIAAVGFYLNRNERQR